MAAISNITATAAPALYEIKNSPGKGLGVFALTDLPEGTRIISEEPLLLRLNRHTRDRDLWNAFREISPGKQHRYLNLRFVDRSVSGLEHFAFEPETADNGTVDEQKTKASKVVSIFWTNAFAAEAKKAVKDDDICGVICAESSRINHSCFPNAHYDYNRSTGRMNVQICEGIRAGTEITISYVPNLLEKTEDRRRELAQWGFTCFCPACDGSSLSRETDTRRSEIATLLAEFAKSEVQTSSLLSSMETRMKVDILTAMMKKEGLACDLSYWSTRVADMFMDRKDIHLKLKYLRLAKSVERVRVGEDHRDFAKADWRLRRWYTG